MVKLIRVVYGSIKTPKHLREYKMNGEGSVGTLKDWKMLYPGMKFEIVDDERPKSLFSTGGF